MPDPSLTGEAEFGRVAEMKSIKQRKRSQKETIKAAHAYAARLFIGRAPQCKPFPSPDILGVLIQIDNLLTGLIEKEKVMPLVDTMDRIYRNALIADGVNVKCVDTIWLRREAFKAMDYANSIGLCKEIE